ncbi:unnamed protein product [Rotaria sordida]|uniref:Uncharacterized protein n=1 Tax=Rotaria sordida TaxID=392033 RepID=A0A820NJV7_9BILA|nr:unnamed protein product [Rotaria sordida]
MDDIALLQLCNSTIAFELASVLFNKKMKYEYKLKSNNCWYEGLQLYAPSINNALEATNKTIKDNGIFRERHSIEQDPSLANARIFATGSTISLEL